MKTTDKVRVRFAPSPTGHVHIGNIRAAIYNWLFARHEGGKFLLRIEDTDIKRCTPEAIQTLLSAMDWLGLNYDEEPVYQTKRLKRHQEVAEFLLKKGSAYLEDKGGTGQGKAVILRITDDAEYKDIVKGKLHKSKEDLKDFVILRSDGTPVFHLANVVDDIDMNITHIIRGDDHVENTYKHIGLYKALDAPLPFYAHLPMIVNDKNKPYSKRDGDAYVGDYQEKGYLPDVLFNFLSLCGWSPGDDREIMSREELIKFFTLERVRPSSAQFDRKKLDWMNQEYIKALPVDELLKKIIPFLKKADHDPEKIDSAWLKDLVKVQQIRITTLPDFIKNTPYFFSEDVTLDPKAISKVLKKDGVLDNLKAVFAILKNIDLWEIEPLKEALETYCKEKNIDNFFNVAQPLRVAITGGTASPPIDDTLKLIGKKRVLLRIEKTIQLLSNPE